MHPLGLIQEIIFQILRNPVTLIAAFGPGLYNIAQAVLVRKSVRSNGSSIPLTDLEGPSWAHALQNFAIQYYTVLASFISFAYAFVEFSQARKVIQSVDETDLAVQSMAVDIVGWIVVVVGAYLIVTAKLAHVGIVQQYFERPTRQLPFLGGFIGGFPPLNRLTVARVVVGLLGLAFVIWQQYAKSILQ